MSLQLLKQIKEFKKKFFHGELINILGPYDPAKKKQTWISTKWSYQHLPDDPMPDGSSNVQFWPDKTKMELKLEDLQEHFSQKSTKTRYSLKGSLGTIGGFEGGKAKWFCIDCDNQKAVDTMRKQLLPVYHDYNIDYIWEFSGTDEVEKAHLWFMCDTVDIALLKRFTEQLFEDAGINFRDRQLGLELYPTIKANNVIRLPGGIHLRTKQINPIEYKGRVGSSAEFILDSFIEADPITEDQIKAVLRAKPEPKKYERKRYGKFLYHSTFTG